MGVAARLLKQELLIHLDYGLPLGGIIVRYRGPINDPDALPEQVVEVLRARVPRDVQFELDVLYEALTRRIAPPPGGRAPNGWVIRPALATVLIQDQQRPSGLPLAWLTYVQQVPTSGPLEQRDIALNVADFTPSERATLDRLRYRIKAIAWAHYQGPVDH